MDTMKRLVRSSITVGPVPSIFPVGNRPAETSYRSNSSKIKIFQECVRAFGDEGARNEGVDNNTFNFSFRGTRYSIGLDKDTSELINMLNRLL